MATRLCPINTLGTFSLKSLPNLWRNIGFRKNKLCHRFFFLNLLHLTRILVRYIKKLVSLMPDGVQSTIWINWNFKTRDRWFPHGLVPPYDTYWKYLCSFAEADGSQAAGRSRRNRRAGTFGRREPPVRGEAQAACPWRSVFLCVPPLGPFCWDLCYWRSWLQIFLKWKENSPNV